MKSLSKHSHNRAAWDRMAKNKNRLAKPAGDEDFINPLKSIDQSGWLGADISDQSVLCLAAGGGRHGPLYAAAGAIVTVVDLSPAMLELDHAVAKKRNLNLRTIETSMDDLSALADQQFDIVIHPVSTCYIPDVKPVYCEIARVLKPSGLYISQHKQPASLQSSLVTRDGFYTIQHPYQANRSLPIEPIANLVREPGTLEFVHPWADLLGAMCRAGFVIEDLTEPQHAQPESEPGSFRHRSQYLAPYVRVKARRTAGQQLQPKKVVWLP